MVYVTRYPVLITVAWGWDDLSEKNTCLNPFRLFRGEKGENITTMVAVQWEKELGWAVICIMFYRVDWGWLGGFEQKKTNV